MSSTRGSVAIARAMHRRCCWPPGRAAPERGGAAVLPPAPRRGGAQVALDEVVELAPRAAPAAQARAGGDVLVDRHRRERVWVLDDHAHEPVHPELPRARPAR